MHMHDPITGFVYPDSWIQPGADLSDLTAVEFGLSVLTSDGTIRRRGFTTGTTVSAAAKAAVLSLAGHRIISVQVMTPSGIRIDLPVIGEDGTGKCSKFSGDYPGDVTAGLVFVAKATQVGNGVQISFGQGIGRWARDTPRNKVGDPAISGPAYNELHEAVLEAMEEIGTPGVSVTIISPDGAAVAKKTLNEMVGVHGGISVLGTTGFVEPWDDHLEQTVCERAAGAEKVVLTTGRTGMRISRLLFPDYEVVLAGSRLGGIIPHLTGEVVICGLPALILKFINSGFLEGTGFLTVEEMMGSDLFTRRMEASFEAYKKEHPDIRVVVVNREGTVIGDSG